MTENGEPAVTWSGDKNYDDLYDGQRVEFRDLLELYWAINGTMYRKKLGGHFNLIIGDSGENPITISIDCDNDNGFGRTMGNGGEVLIERDTRYGDDPGGWSIVRKKNDNEFPELILGDDGWPLLEPFRRPPPGARQASPEEVAAVIESIKQIIAAPPPEPPPGWRDQRAAALEA